jgi:putative PIN family toxin of toxin-antitoxin system
MRVLIDTNILISAALWPASVPARAYQKATSEPYSAFVSSYTISELKNVFTRKFPAKLKVLDTFVNSLRNTVEIVQVSEPDENSRSTHRLRDAKDEPILQAALDARVEFLITGDKDFLDACLDAPQVITAADFLKLN